MISQLFNGIGSVVSGIQANKTFNNILGSINKQQKQVDNLFNQNYYQNYMNRSDVQGLLGNLRNNLEQQNQANMATMGTNNSIEALAAMSRNQAMGMGQAMGGIVSQADNRKDQLMNNYINTSTGLLGHQNGMQLGQLSEQQKMINSVADNAGNILESAVGFF